MSNEARHHAVNRLLAIFRECCSDPPTDDELRTILHAAMTVGAEVERIAGTRRTLEAVHAAYREGRGAGRGGAA